MEIRRVGEVVWEIPRSGAMRVPARIYASEAQMGALRADPALVQLAQVAELPGIVGHAMAMPDVHWGYGFPIGGVAAVDADDGVITPGGIGFDINCGVRLLRTRLEVAAVEAVRDRLADRLFAAVPAGWDRRARCRRSLRATSGACSSAVRHGRSRRASDVRPTSSTARMAGGSPAPIRTPSPRRRGRVADRRSARSAPAITSWRSSGWIGSTTRRPRPRSASRRDRSPS
jgi:RNA-splicing ligase RtcB